MHSNRFAVTARHALAVVAAVAFFSLPVVAADYRAEDYQPLVKQVPSSKHMLVEIIREAGKSGETVIEAKMEMDGANLMIGAYTSVKGLAVEPENTSYKEYNGLATEAAWKPKVEVFTDFKHIARSAQYHALLSLTKFTLLDFLGKAEKDQPGTPIEVKAMVQNAKPVVAVIVAQDGKSSRVVYDLASGAKI